MASIKNLLNKILIQSLRFYRYFISPLLGNHCRFHPSCSLYAEDALAECGVIKGSWLTLKRLVKCHPFHPGGYDPIQITQGKKHGL